MMNEKAYKIMNIAGIGNVAIGIIVITVGITVGILSIVSGVKLIKEKKNLIF